MHANDPTILLAATLADIERITREADPVLRNLQITQRYHDLSRALLPAGGPGSANWSTFATWASKTAGQSIRGEEVPRELLRALAAEAQFEATLDRLLRSVGLGFMRVDLDLFDVARAAVAEISAQVAEGNLKVFAELAPLFARFSALLAADDPPDDHAVAAFVAELRPGSAADGGQDALKAAFTSYGVAARTADGKLRAERTLYANLLIGLHEQTRLQPNIEAGLGAPVSPKVHDEVRSALTAPLMPLLHAILASVREGWERVATRFLMRLMLPRGGSLSLGEDIPGGRHAFPASLAELTHAELVTLVRTYDPHIDSARGSAARNWTLLADRMGFIIDLFRSHQEQADLHEPPFAADLRADIAAGRVPAGDL